MKQFVLAFPLQVSDDEVLSLSETVQIASDAKTLMVPGCGVQFNVVRKGHVDGLSDIFKEHQEISTDDAESLNAHKSLLFLLGEVKSMDDLRMVNTAILKILAAGALGVYMQHSGTAWTAAAFRDTLDDAEFPMDPWINFIESEDSFYTLGLAIFALPDLCAAKTVENAESALLMAADALFGDGIPAKSGSEIDLGEGEVFKLRAEAKNPFPKDAPEYNTQGVMRIVKKV